jgi:hypothetical protein
MLDSWSTIVGRCCLFLWLSCTDVLVLMYIVGVPGLVPPGVSSVLGY